MAQVNKQEIQNKLAGLIKQYIPSLQNEEITSETTINSKGYESLNYIYIICTLDFVYGVNIPDKSWMILRTVGEVVVVVYNACTK